MRRQVSFLCDLSLWFRCRGLRAEMRSEVSRPEDCYFVAHHLHAMSVPIRRVRTDCARQLSSRSALLGIRSPVHHGGTSLILHCSSSAGLWTSASQQFKYQYFPLISYMLACLELTPLTPARRQPEGACMDGTRYLMRKLFCLITPTRALPRIHFLHKRLLWKVLAVYLEGAM